ncbi:MAG: hypothetical protein ABS949_10915 [Solibacillus sp.]
MNYSELLSSYIKNSKMSLSEISDKLKEMGFSTDKTYLSKLQNGKIPAAGGKLNNALAKILNGDETKLEVLAYIDKSPESIKSILSNFDNEVLEMLLDLNRKYPNGTLDLLGDNDIGIEYSTDLERIKEHFIEISTRLLKSGESEFINDITIQDLKDQFNGYLDFEKYESEIRNHLQSNGLDFTIKFIMKLIYSESSKKNEPYINIQDPELLQWYTSLPTNDEKKLKKLKSLWEMIDD